MSTRSTPPSRPVRADRGSAADQRLRHPADDRPRRAAVRRAGARDAARGAPHAARRPNPEVAKPDGEPREDGPEACPTTVPYKAPAGSVDRDGLRRPARSWRWRATRRSTTAGSRPACRATSSSRSSRATTDGDPIDPDQSILVNRAIQGRYNMGSTFKPFTAYAALNTGLISAGRATTTTRATYTHAQSVDRGPLRRRAGALRVQERHLRRHRSGRAGTGRSTSTTRSPCRATRSSTASARTDHGPQRLRAGAAGAGRAVRVRLRHRHRPAVRVRRHGARQGAQEAVRRARRASARTRAAATSPATTSSWRSGRACCRRRRCSSPSATRRSPTAASCSGPRSCKAIWNPGVPDGETGLRRLRPRHDRRGVVRRPGADPPGRRCRARSATADRATASGACVTPGARRRVGLLPLHDRRESVLRLPGRGDPDRRQDRHRPGRQQLPVERLVGVHRVQHRRRRSPYIVTAYLEKSGYGSQAAAPVVKCMFLALSGITADRPGRAVRPARPQQPTSPRRRCSSPTRRAATPGRRDRHHRMSRRAERPTESHAWALTFLPAQARQRARQRPLEPRRPEPQHRLGAAAHPGRADGDRAASSCSRRRAPGSSSDPYAFVTRQVVFGIIAAVVMFVVMSVDYEWLKERATFFYGLTLVILSLLFIVGLVNGRDRISFDFGPFNFQPAEMAKFTTLLRARRLPRRRAQRRGQLPPVPRRADARRRARRAVILQPDLGSASVLISIAMGVLLVAGAKPKYIALISVLSLATVAAAFISRLVNQYQIERLRVFVDQNDHRPAAAGLRLPGAQRDPGGRHGRRVGQGMAQGPAHQRPRHPRDVGRLPVRRGRRAVRPGRLRGAAGAVRDRPRCGSGGSPRCHATCSARTCAPACSRCCSGRCSRTSG